jgi:hypothetical protein
MDDVEVLRTARRLVLLPAVLLGIVTMHALAIGPPTALAPAMAATHAPSAEHSRMLDSPPAADATPTSGTGTATLAGVVSTGAMATDDPAPGPMPPMSGHDLMHLCLAVLAALLVLLVGLVRLEWAHLRGSAVADRLRTVHPTSRRPPPGHAARQAELCVLRN